MLCGRFGPRYTASTAVHAVSNLQQGPKESCASFLDQVVLAVDKTTFNVSAETKALDGYKDMLTSSILAHFGAGLRDSIGKVVLSAPVPPKTVPDMLTAEEAVEMELAKIGSPGSSVLAVDGTTAEEPEAAKSKTDSEKLSEK